MQSFRYTLLLTFLLCTTFATHGEVPTSETPDWIHHEKIRAFWSPPLELFAPLHEAGFNVIIQRLETAVDSEQREAGFLHGDEPFKQVEGATRNSSRRAKALGMRYFHCLDPGAARSVILAGFKDNPRRFHDGQLPCPLDSMFWDRVIGDRFLHVIDMLAGEEFQLDGLIVDPEMYSFNGAFLSIPCYCDDCARDFSDAFSGNTEVVDVALEERAEWFAERNGGEEYERWQEDRVAARMAAMREAIHKKDPNLVLGFLIFRNRPWFKAMARGLSTEENPVLILPEGTYSGVYNDDYLAYQEGLKEKVGVPFLYCPGIWVGYDVDGNIPTAFMEVVPGNVYHRSIRSAGYWVYAANRWGGNAEKAQPFTDLFRTINQEIDRYQVAGGSYESGLTARPLPVERPGNLHELLLEARDWQRVNEVPHTIPATTGTIALRGQHQVVINARKGDELVLELQNIQLGDYTSEGRIVLYNPGMEVVVDATCGVNQRITHPFTVEWEGPYVLLASAGSGVPNAFTVTITGAPWTLYGDKISLNKRGGSVYFWVGEETSSLELTLSGAGKESVTYTLYDPEGKEALHRVNVDNKETHHVDCQSRSGIWTLEASDIVDDGYFSVTGIQRYALDPANVVKD